jgi:drug/metabolite transporter (DMT)-like permease
MAAITLGLIAALAWGLHDISVRYISQKLSVFTALLTVLITGAFFQLLVILVRSEFSAMPPAAAAIAIASGVAFALANIGLYKAFEIGPVGLVAPITATFPILSVLAGIYTGQIVTIAQWLAILSVLGGISIVAILSDTEDTPTNKSRRKAAIGWASLASVSFAITFGLGQSLMETAPEMMVVFIVRLAAITVLLAIMIYLKAQYLPSIRQLPFLAAMGFFDATALTCVLTAGSLPNANYAAVAASAFGVVTIVLAWAFLKERMKLIQWVGVAITFSGIAYLAS